MSTARLALLLVLVAPCALAQVPLTLVNDSTTVGTLEFDFEDTQTLLVENLELQVATKAPPPSFLFGFIGGPEEGAVYPFDPIELARDVVRLERHYAASGFPRADVDYAVALDTTDNTVAVTFEILEGPPLIISGVAFAGPGQRPVAPELAPEIRDEWADFTAGRAVREGDRLDAFALVQLQGETVAWLRNRGYAWADAGAERFVDSTGLAADVRVKVNVGVRTRLGRVRVEGDSSLSANVVTRELGVETGDLFDASALAEGQREIFGLGLFTLALVDVSPEAVRGDTIVPVRIRVQRGPSRVLSAFTGYFSDGGVTLRSSATHRNAFGGARQLSANVEWRTGIGSGLAGGSQSVTGGPIRDFRVSLPFRQPYVLDRRLSYTLQPSYRVRDDEIESSTQTEVSNTLLFTRSPLQTIGVSLTGRSRDLSRGLGIRLLDAGRFEPGVSPLLPDALRATTGVVGLDVVWGQLDDPLQPRRGYVTRPSFSVAAGDVSYGRGRVATSLTVPIGSGRRTGIVGRVVAGGIAPFGGSDVDTVGDYVLLRDQLFYAGGTSDVRGWASAQLGPKTFSITAPSVVSGEIPDPSRVTSARDISYVGVGGRLKGSGSLQLNLPLPIGPQWGANVFVDGGIVAASSAAATNGLIRAGGTRADSSLADQLDLEGGLRIGTGAGIQYLTPVGFVSVAIGVKVNPSYLDLRTPALVYCGSSIFEDDPVCFGGDEIDAPTDDTALGYVDARLSGADFDPDAIEPDKPIFGRLQFHLSIGQTF